MSTETVKLDLGSVVGIGHGSHEVLDLESELKSPLGVTYSVLFNEGHIGINIAPLEMQEVAASFEMGSGTIVEGEGRLLCVSASLITDLVRAEYGAFIESFFQYENGEMGAAEKRRVVKVRCNYVSCGKDVYA